MEYILEFKEDLKELKKLFGVFNNKELSTKLGITEDAVKGWSKRKTIPKKYLKLLEEDKNNILNTIQSNNQINGNNVNLIGSNSGDININTKSRELEEELIKAIRQLSDKKKEYYYYKIKADLLEENL